MIGSKYLIISLLFVTTVFAARNQISRKNECNCRFVVMPVCGTDNQTYVNMCSLKCMEKTNDKIKLQSLGKCSPATNIKTSFEVHVENK
jgi:hypothetical protein